MGFIRTFLSISILSTIPQPPPIKQSSPTFVLPAMAVFAPIIVFFPILQLWAMWTWLSNLRHYLKRFPNEPLSIVQAAPISTSSASVRFPKCSIFSQESLFLENPKPSDPKTEFAWIMFFYLKLLMNIWLHSDIDNFPRLSLHYFQQNNLDQLLLPLPIFTFWPM